MRLVPPVLLLTLVVSSGSSVSSSPSRSGPTSFTESPTLREELFWKQRAPKDKHTLSDLYKAALWSCPVPGNYLGCHTDRGVKLLRSI